MVAVEDIDLNRGHERLVFNSCNTYGSAAWEGLALVPAEGKIDDHVLEV